MTRLALRRWFWLHKWTSLICTAFLLVICITGMPLVFREEIGNLLNDSLPYASVPNGAATVNLDRVVADSREMYPGETVMSAFIDDDEPQIVVTLTPSWDAYRANNSASHWIKFDAHTGAMLKQSKPFNRDGRSFLDIMLSLHRDLFIDLPGELFMGAMALLFVIAIVSGVVIYGPFMRKLDFATVRTHRTRRIRWLDLHNLIGIVTLCWTLVVGATGVLNELSTPLFGLWQRTDVRAMLAPMQNRPVPSDADLSSIQSAYDTVKAAVPNMVVTSVIFPGSPFGTPYHYLVWTKGKEPLTSRLFSPVLVDARSGALAAVVTMPWYLRALEVSRPLHFGDYGGMPLKIIWALLDLATIMVLGSGLYLWLSRKPSSSSEEAESELVASYEAAAPRRPAKEAAE